MALDLEAVKARYLPDRNGAEAFAQSDAAARDVPALVAEVEQLREDLRIANEATLVLVERAVEAESTVQRLIAQADGAARRVAELEVRSLADEVRAAQEATRAARGAWADQ